MYPDNDKSENYWRYIGAISVAFVIGIGFSYGALKTGSWFLKTTTNSIKTASSSIDTKASLADSVTSLIPPAPGSPADVATNEYEEDPTSIIEQAKDSLPHTTTADKIGSEGYIVTDLSSGKILIQQNANRALPIASITKLVTAVVERSLIDPDARIEITKKVLTTEGTSGLFRNGEIYTPEQLLYPLLMVSSNDAAEAYAQSYGRRKFLQAMNTWTSSIGAYNTYFADPSGLSKDNIASAHDVAIIMQWIATHEPDLLDITLTKTKAIHTHTWTNPTHFLNLSTYRGGKNGYTDEAGRTGVSIFRTKDRAGVWHDYVIVVLKSANRDHDELLLLQQAAAR